MSVKTDAIRFDLCPVSGKRKFRTQARAYVFLGGLQKRNRRKGDKHPVHVYRCGCGFWHLGHVNKTPPAKREPRTRIDPTERAMSFVRNNWQFIECKRLAIG